MDPQSSRIGFIGGGNMAQAIVAGLLRAGHRPGAIAVAEPAAPARERLAALGAGLVVGTDNAAVAAACDVLVLAVKPQVMPAVLAGLGAVARPAGQVAVSIAAGVTLGTLGAALGPGTAVVRVMPNQPALVGQGMSVLVAAPGVADSVRERATYIAAATGKAAWIADESLMDAVTAVSGSGPAYFYLLMEMMEAAAVELGLPRDVAVALVRQTALGAAQAAPPGSDVAALRASVTSPGGTTAAALAVLEAAGIREAFRRAITAARDRGAELGRGPR